MKKCSYLYSWLREEFVTIIDEYGSRKTMRYCTKGHIVSLYTIKRVPFNNADSIQRLLIFNYVVVIIVWVLAHKNLSRYNKCQGKMS